MAQHGLLKGSNSKSATFKIPSADQLSLKPVDPAKLEVSILLTSLPSLYYWLNVSYILVVYTETYIFS